MKSVCVLVAVLVAAVAADVPVKEQDKGYYGHANNVRYGYNGKYNGKCGNDGFYLNDPYSFVICSNGNAYVQPCAPGTRNNPGRYSQGSYYAQSDFCNENLNDYGYGAPAGAHPAPYRPAYGSYPYYGYPGYGFPTFGFGFHGYRY